MRSRLPGASRLRLPACEPRPTQSSMSCGYTKVGPGGLCKCWSAQLMGSLVCVFIPVPVRHRLPTTLHARPTTNAHALFWTAELQQAQLAAEGRVSQAEAAAAELRERQGELAARRAGLQHELGSAERRAASAR